MRISSALLSLAALVTSASATGLYSLGQTVEIGGVPYYVPSGPKTSLTLDSAPSGWSAGLLPLTILASSAEGFSTSVLKKATESFAENDDVWCEGFLEAVLYTTESSDSKSSYAVVLEDTVGLKARSSTPTATGTPLPNGPYFGFYDPSAKTLKVYEAFRLYADVAQAFMYGVVPTTGGFFTTLSASLAYENGVPTVGVPSRLYYTKTSEQPLAGLRFGVKDLYDVAGLKTSMGNRAWLSLYPPVNTTAVSIQRLLDLGAVLVGKTRLSQFANGQYGTADNVDYLTPFNARGDGYQDPSSSSSGAGASSGNYPWLDFSVGSDTGGSIRAPAGVEGVYGNRPSQGAIDLTGALVLSPAMDTAAFVARDPKVFAYVAKAWYGGNSSLTVFPTGTPYPKTLLYPINPAADLNQASPGFFPVADNATQELFDGFVSKLEAHIGVNRTVYDFYAENYNKFSAYPADYVGTVWTLLIAYDQWNLVGKSFHADYAAAHDGDIPFADQPIRFDWEYGANLTAANRTFWWERKESWREWVNTEVLPPNAETCSEALWVHPIITGGPSYKSDYHDATTAPYNGWNRYGMSQLAGVPEIVLTFDQVPYVSTITNTTKHLPIAISILAAQGCDFILYDLADSLADAGLIKKTQTGPLTYAITA